MTDSNRTTYRDAGVDIDKGNTFVQNIKAVIASTHQRGVVNEIGGFSSLFAIDKDKYDNPVLVSSTDGVGTKLAVAKMCGISISPKMSSPESLRDVERPSAHWSAAKPLKCRACIQTAITTWQVL